VASSNDDRHKYVVIRQSMHHYLHLSYADQLTQRIIEQRRTLSFSQLCNDNGRLSN